MKTRGAKNLFREGDEVVLYCGRHEKDEYCRAKPLLRLSFPHEREARIKLEARCAVCHDKSTATVENNPPAAVAEKIPKTHLAWDDADVKWVKVKREWVTFKELRGELPPRRLEARSEYYGCESGCEGYRVYLVDGDDESLVDGFCFGGRDEARREAEDYAAEHGIDCIVVEADGL